MFSANSVFKSLKVFGLRTKHRSRVSRGQKFPIPLSEKLDALMR